MHRGTALGAATTAHGRDLVTRQTVDASRMDSVVTRPRVLVAGHRPLGSTTPAHSSAQRLEAPESAWIWLAPKPSEYNRRTSHIVPVVLPARVVTDESEKRSEMHCRRHCPGCMNGDQLGAEANDWLQPWFGPEELSTREGTSNVDFDVDMAIGQVWAREERAEMNAEFFRPLFFSLFLFGLETAVVLSLKQSSEPKLEKKKALSASSSESRAPILASCSCLGRRDRFVPPHNISLSLGMVLSYFGIFNRRKSADPRILQLSGSQGSMCSTAQHQPQPRHGVEKDQAIATLQHALQSRSTPAPPKTVPDCCRRVMETACLGDMATSARSSFDPSSWPPTRVGLKWATSCTAR
ncbi:hypothetical protein L1887_44526 [Cichorium endivia]|nr:hypothetical protein L1887_44526 [Cichorium endivia]